MSDISDVRLLISDVGGEDENTFIFEDADITRFLALRGNNVFRAGALALRTMASNEAMVSKRIKFLDLSTDGPAVAKSLREDAKELERVADEGEDSDFDIAEMVVSKQSEQIKRGIRNY